MRLRYKISLIVVAVSLGVCLMTFQSYALWVKDMVAEQENVVEVGCFEIEYTAKENTEIQLQNTYPVDDSKGLSGTPYTFTITNKCTIDDSYIVTLNTKNSNKIEAGSVTVGTDNAGQDITEPFAAFNMTDKVKYAISKEKGIANGETDPNKPTKGENLGEYAKKDENINTDKSKLPNPEEIDKSIIIGSGTLKGKQGDTPGESVTYHLYLWLDGDQDETGKDKVGNEVMGQSFHASVHIINHATNSNDEQGDEPGGEESQLPQDVLDKVDEPDDDGNGLFTVTSDLEGWTEPELRYAGVNYNESSPETPYVHNYVTFNEEVAGWRIIGLVNVLVIQPDGSKKVEQRLKIIKDKSIGEKAWDSGNVNDWTNASLMKKLNEEQGEYYKTLTEDAKGMIDDSIIWNLGGISSSDSQSLKANEFYKKERGTEVYQDRPTEWPKPEGETYTAGTALVGLMYPSEVGVHICSQISEL